jgi:hypothetical protein
VARRRSLASIWATTSTARSAATAGTPATATGRRRCSPGIGLVRIEVPRDGEGWLDPQIVRKRQRRLDGIDEIVLSLSARGLTTGEVAAHFAEVYGAKVSKDTISRITDKVVEQMTEWGNRQLDRGRFLSVVANLDWKDSRCRAGRGTRRAGAPPGTATGQSGAEQHGLRGPCRASAPPTPRPWARTYRSTAVVLPALVRRLVDDRRGVSARHCSS